MMSSTPKERRYPRIAGPIRVYDVAAKPAESFVTRNISLGGLFVLSEKRPPVGSSKELLIEHRKRTATVCCRVTHLQADGFGAAFVAPTNELLEFVRSIIDELLAGGADSVKERRREPRSPADAQVVWNQTDSSHPGRLRNISGSGALIESADCPELHTDVLVYLPGYTYDATSPHPSEARGCIARVMHKVSYGFGVQFVEPSAEFRMALGALMRETRARSAG
jgi:hypothetical protein